MFALLAGKLALSAITALSMPDTPQVTTTVQTTLIPPASAYDQTITEDSPGWQCDVMGDRQCATVPYDAPTDWQSECYLLAIATRPDVSIGYLPRFLPSDYWNACMDMEVGPQ